MPKYRVYIDQTVQYSVDVEADSAEAAEEKALKLKPEELEAYCHQGYEIRDDLTAELKPE